MLTNSVTYLKLHPSDFKWNVRSSTMLSINSHVLREMSQLSTEKFSTVTNSYFPYVFHVRNKVSAFTSNTQKTTHCHTVFESTSYTTKWSTAPMRTRGDTQLTPNAHRLRAQQHKKKTLLLRQKARAQQSGRSFRRCQHKRLTRGCGTSHGGLEHPTAQKFMSVLNAENFI